MQCIHNVADKSNNRQLADIDHCICMIIFSPYSFASPSFDGFANFQYRRMFEQNQCSRHRFVKYTSICNICLFKNYKNLFFTKTILQNRGVRICHSNKMSLFLYKYHCYSIDYRTPVWYNYIWVLPYTVGGCSLRRDCDSPFIQNSTSEIFRKEGNTLLTIEGLIAVLSLMLTSFGLGYAIGRTDKTQK